MGLGICKVGDIGIGVCSCHTSPVMFTTTFVSGAPTVLVNGLPAANFTTIGVSTCGHATVVLSASATVILNGSGAHRLGDIGKNCGGTYTAVSGSPNVNSG